MHGPGKHGDSNSGSSGGGDAVGMLSATHPGFSGDVLRVEISGDGAPAVGAGLLRASAGGQDVFEVKVGGLFSPPDYLFFFLFFLSSHL